MFFSSRGQHDVVASGRTKQIAAPGVSWFGDINLDPPWRRPANKGVRLKAVPLLVCLAACLLPGCAVLRQLDEWSRPKIRYINPRDIGPDGLPNAKRKGYVNKFIIASEIPVEEFYPSQWHSSGD
jgi:hypothetical protein